MKVQKRAHLVQGGEEEWEDKGKVIEIGPYKEGESMMVRRMQQQNKALVSIFKKNCVSHGKICKMIIDFGSFDNLVSYEMVNKLKLQKFPIERPYKASWVSDEQNIIVREQAFFHFSIGSYADRVLGRSWQASRDTTHHGLENVYIVHIDGLNFFLNPLPSNDGDDGRIVCVGENKYITLEDQTARWC